MSNISLIVGSWVSTICDLCGNKRSCKIFKHSNSQHDDYEVVAICFICQKKEVEP